MVLLEKLSYISVIFAALVVSGSAIYDRAVAVKRLPGAQTNSQGKPLALKGVEWARHKGTLVLALSTTCHFCSASVPFYRELSAMQSRRPDLNLVAIFPQSLPEAAKYLSAKGIFVNKVMSEPLNEIMVGGTPTMYFVGRDGLIKETWVGFLNDERRSAALAQVVSLLKG